MSLKTDNWHDTKVSNLATQTFTIPIAIPAGRMIFVALGCTGAALVTAMGSVRSNPWVIELSGAHSTNTFNVTLASMKVINAISAGDTFTVTASAARNKWTLAAAVFSGVNILPVNKVVAALLSTAQPTPVTTATPSLAVPRALVVTAVAMTGTGSPIGPNVNRLADQAVTTVGSADRGCALLYKEEGGTTHTNSYTVTASASSAAVTAAYSVPDLPAGTIPYMTVDGEVPGTLKYWDGTTEHAVTGLESAPIPTAPAKMIGMSAPTPLWDSRLADIGAANVTCRRIFADMTPDGTSQSGVIERAISDNMLPVISYKEPVTGATADVDGVIAGTYDSWIANIKSYLTSLDTDVIAIFHHEARGDMTQAQFLAASRRWLDLMQTSRIKIAPINMGFLLDTSGGRTEFNTWSNADLLNDWDYFGIDTYHTGTFAAPGTILPGDRIPPLLTWLSNNGHADKPIIIGEYNGWTAAALASAGEKFLSTPSIHLAMVFNSDSGSKGEPLTGDRLTAFRNTKSDARVLTTYTP